jgi:hypothetical protein
MPLGLYRMDIQRQSMDMNAYYCLYPSYFCLQFFAKNMPEKRKGDENVYKSTNCERKKN